MIRVAVALAAACALLARAAAAEPSAPVPDTRDWILGLSVGWGHGFDLGAGGAADVDYLALLPRAGFTLAESLGGDGLLRGSAKLFAEGTLLVSLEPGSGHAEGLGLLLRYDFLAGRRLVPYVEAGAGIANLDFDLPVQRDGFNFTLQGGGGLLFRVGERTALSAGYRLHHISNAYTRSPNLGIDSHLLLVGIRLLR